MSSNNKTLRNGRAMCLFSGQIQAGGGGSTTFTLEPIAGAGIVRDFVIFLHVMGVTTPTTTSVAVALKHSANGNVEFAPSYATLISTTTPTPPVALVATADPDTNNSFGEYLHFEITVAGGASHVAQLELWIVPKPQ